MREEEKLLNKHEVEFQNFLNHPVERYHRGTHEIVSRCYNTKTPKATLFKDVTLTT